MSVKPVYECTPEEVLEINTVGGDQIQIGNVIRALILQEGLAMNHNIKSFMSDPYNKNACGIPLRRAEKYIYRKYLTLRCSKFISIQVAKQALRISKQLLKYQK